MIVADAVYIPITQSPHGLSLECMVCYFRSLRLIIAGVDLKLQDMPLACLPTVGILPCQIARFFFQLNNEGEILVWHH